MENLNNKDSQNLLDEDCVMGFRIPKKTKEKLIKCAYDKSEKDGIRYKASDIIRFAINDYLKKEAISSQPYQDDC